MAPREVRPDVSGKPGMKPATSASLRKQQQQRAKKKQQEQQAAAKKKQQAKAREQAKGPSEPGAPTPGQPGPPKRTSSIKPMVDGSRVGEIPTDPADFSDHGAAEPGQGAEAAAGKANEGSAWSRFGDLVNNVLEAVGLGGPLKGDANDARAGAAADPAKGEGAFEAAGETSAPGEARARGAEEGAGDDAASDSETTSIAFRLKSGDGKAPERTVRLYYEVAGEAKTMEATTQDGDVEFEGVPKDATYAIEILPPPPPPPPVVLTLDLVDPEGKPLAGVRVEAKPAGGKSQFGVSDANGRVSLSGFESKGVDCRIIVGGEKDNA